MSEQHTGNVQPSVDLEEHRSKNVNAKAVVEHGYIPGTDQYVPITAVDNGDGTYGLKTSSAAAAGGATESKQTTQIDNNEELSRKLGLLLDRLDFGLVTSNAKQLKIIAENPTVANLLATVTFAANQDIRTVASLTNTVRQGDLQVQRVNEAILDMAFSNGITSNLAF